MRHQSTMRISGIFPKSVVDQNDQCFQPFCKVGDIAFSGQISPSSLRKIGLFPMPLGSPRVSPTGFNVGKLPNFLWKNDLEIVECGNYDIVVEQGS